MATPRPQHRLRRHAFRAARPALALLLCAGLGAAGEQGGLPQMSLEEILSVKLTVASRTETTVLDAPSVVSLITAEDIRRMGARDLRDVLRGVPGFELGTRVFGYPEFGVRGVITDNSEKVRILLDGVPVNENLEGSGTIVFGDLALDNVERIEIIRGPGSALYGTNAFVGVISIITKTPPASGGSTTFTARAGSFHTGEGSVLTGWSGPKLRVSAYLHYLDTDGPREPIERDALPDQGGLNQGVSLAGGPDGHTYLDRKKLTAQLKADYGSFYFNATYVDARKGPYVGTLWTVNRHSEAHPSQLQGAAGWILRPTADLEVEPRVYALHYKADNLWNGYPEGTRVSDGNGGTVDYTQGRYDRQGGTQDTYGSELRATWTALRAHKLVGGVSYEKERLYRVVNLTNVPGYGSDRMVDAGPIMRKNPDRSLFSAYLQDQWSLTKALGLTAGVRMDRYEDAGTAVNPRLALVWRPLEPLNLKLLYGEAFRAPTFVESYLFAYGGFAQGRASNQPETIKTLEAEGSWRFGDRALWRVALFRNRIKDLLQLVPSAGHLEYQNIPDETVVKGVETEVKLTFTDALSGFVNYSSQSGRNQATGAVLVGTANWRGNVGLNVMAAEGLNFSAALNVVGERQRAAGDTRPALKGYRVLDGAVNWSPTQALGFMLSVHNALDADQRFPDVSGQLPNDFPWEGRAVEFGVKVKF